MRTSFLSRSSQALLCTDIAVEDVNCVLRRDLLLMIHSGGTSFQFHFTPFSTVQAYNPKRQTTIVRTPRTSTQIQTQITQNNNSDPISPLTSSLSIRCLSPPITPRGRFTDVDFDEKCAFEVANIMFEGKFVAIVLVMENRVSCDEWIVAIQNNISLLVVESFGLSLAKQKQRRIIFTERKRPPGYITNRRLSRSPPFLAFECSGWLIRKNLDSHVWHLVFCLVTDDELQFFKDADLRELISSVPLTNHTLISLIDGSPFGFQVREQNLAAFCEDDRRKWIRSVSERIQRAQMRQKELLQSEDHPNEGPSNDAEDQIIEEKSNSNSNNEDDHSVSMYSDIEILTADDELSVTDDTLSIDDSAPDRNHGDAPRIPRVPARLRMNLKIDLKQIEYGHRNAVPSSLQQQPQQSQPQFQPQATQEIATTGTSPQSRMVRMLSRIWTRNKTSESGGGKRSIESKVRSNQQEMDELCRQLEEMKSRLSAMDSQYSELLQNKERAIDQLMHENQALRSKLGTDTETPHDTSHMNPVPSLQLQLNQTSPTATTLSIPLGAHTGDLTSSGSSSFRSSELASPHQILDIDHVDSRHPSHSHDAIVISAPQISSQPSVPPIPISPTLRSPTPSSGRRGSSFRSGICACEEDTGDESPASTADCLSSPTAMAHALKKKLSFVVGSARRESAYLASPAVGAGNVMLESLHNSIFEDVVNVQKG